MEIWKPIFGGKYHISSIGRIKSYGIRSNGQILKLRTDINGYHYYGFYFNGAVYTKKIHRILAIEFIPNDLNKKCVNHINGIKTDNRVENLEWCTHSENTKHGYKIGTNKVGELQRIGMSERMRKKIGINSTAGKSITDGEIIFPTIKSAAEFYGIKHKTLSAMLTGQNKNKTNLKFIEDARSKR